MEIFTGCTAMANKNGLSIIDDCLYVYIGSRSSLAVPEGVTQICRSAFRANEKIKAIQLPASLKKINDRAFEDCRKLQDVLFPEGMINKKGTKEIWLKK